ncbi:MAG: SOS response-associated peptidase [Candidatus Berkiella sp.]
MCGRFALFASEQDIVSHFKLKRGFFMQPRYNIAPTQTIPVVLAPSQQIDFYRWGFIPSWHKKQIEIPKGHINARIESIQEKPTFKQAFTQSRCLIPANGYYEWKAINNRKQPFFVQLTEAPLFAFAGISSIWQTQTGEMIMSCAIITMPAPAFLQRLHERMPVILSPENYSFWLAKENRIEDISTYLAAMQPDKIKIIPVSARMSHPQFEGIECIQSL